jgi:hypothetical protein
MLVTPTKARDILEHQALQKRQPEHEELHHPLSSEQGGKHFKEHH